MKFRFSATDCRQCPRLALCTYSKSQYPRRLLTVRPQQQHEALQTSTHTTVHHVVCPTRGHRSDHIESGCVLSICVVHALSDERRRDCNMSALLLLSTSFVSLRGFEGKLPCQHVSQLLSDSSRLLSKGLPAVSNVWKSHDDRK